VDKLKSGATRLGIALSDANIGQFETYYKELVDWNTRVNLTSITDYDEAQLKHFLDSLTVVLAKIPTDAKVIDVGTGAGLPGIPLKLVFPEIRLTLLEATGKKTAFLKHVVETLGLKDTEIVTGRAEDIAQQPEYREKFDVVLARAVAPMAALAELTLPFCKIAGIVIAQKKGDIASELSEAAKAVEVLGGSPLQTISADVPGLTDSRCLVVIKKISPTPPQYPRRPGIPAKKPLK
jgi:16S rRNA (guanine527-N7)-methyltransferase